MFNIWGESTVKVKGNGVGGRNMELALSFAIGISGKRKFMDCSQELMA